jgi:predicted anti-sigma-YlaC factor YlaD
MNCEEVRKYFDDYILGEIEETIEIQVNEHLVDCKGCQKEFEEKEKLINLFMESQKFEPTDDIYRRIRNRIKMPKTDKKLFWGLSKNFAYTAVAFLFGVFLMRAVDVFFIQRTESPRVEIRYAPSHKEHYSDTIEFYSTPPKNLAKI